MMPLTGVGLQVLETELVPLFIRAGRLKCWNILLRSVSTRRKFSRRPRRTGTTSARWQRRTSLRRWRPTKRTVWLSGPSSTRSSKPGWVPPAAATSVFHTEIRAVTTCFLLQTGQEAGRSKEETHSVNGNCYSSKEKLLLLVIDIRVICVQQSNVFSLFTSYWQQLFCKSFCIK